MIFDDLDSPGPDRPQPPEESRRRRRPRSTEEDARGVRESSGRRRRRRSSSRHEPAARRDEPEAYPVPDRNHVAWLCVLGLLIVASMGFAWYLHSERTAPYKLPGSAPSARLLPYVDPVLAPLETGDYGYNEEVLQDLAAELRSDGEKVNSDDREIYRLAGTINQILTEAVDDRVRHLGRLAKLGADVTGTSVDPSEVRGDLGEAERKHLELAVAISWQRNSGSYRNRVEELWARLARLERGRFRAGAADAVAADEAPHATPTPP